MIQSRPLDLNILPERYRPHRITASMAAAIVVVAALLLGFIPAYAAFATARAQTAAGQARLDRTQAALAQAQVDRAALEEVEQQIEHTRAQVARLQAEFDTLSQWRTPRSASIAAAVAALVPRVRITTIAQEKNLFILTGKAGSQALVLDYARALQPSGQFANVRILSMVNADPLGLAPEVEFSIAMEQ